MKVKSLGCVRLCATPWTAAYQAPQSMGFSRQEYWSRLPLPSPDQPRQHIKKQRHYFAKKVPSSQGYCFPGGHIWIGEGNGTPLQYSCLENPMDGGAWWVADHGVANSQTRLSDFTFTFHFHALEKAMATHSSVLAWRIPGMGKPGGLLSMGSHRVGHD